MPLIANPQHAISLGGLSLVSAGKPVTHPAGFTTEVSADGTTWGNPSVAVSSLISQLSDGDMVRQDRVGNREPVLFVRITANGHAALVSGDTALSAVVGHAAELTWTPPGPGSPTTVIDVVHSRMDHQWDDMNSRRYVRVWVVTMSALPWVRSAAKVVTPAVTPITPTVVDSGSAVTNWSSPSSGAVVSVVTGAVTSTYSPSVSTAGFFGTTLVRNLPGTLNTSSAKYIGIDWKASLTVLQAARTSASPANMTEVRRDPAPTAGFVRSWYKLADTVSSISSLTFGVIHPSNAAASATLSIDQVLLANELPSTGTARQRTRIVAPGGNVPAEGDVLVQSPTNALGRTIVFSHPAGGGYTPSLRQWLTSSSGPIANAGMVSGFYNDLTAPMVYSVPISAIPESGAQLWIKCGASTTSAVRINWSATTWQGGVAQVNSRQSGNTLISVPSVGPQYLFPIANVTLPPSRVADSGTGYVVIIVERDASSSATNVTLDETWVFATDRGRLTVIDCGDNPATPGLNGSRLRISAPSLTRPYGELQVATLADWSNSWEPAGGNILCDQTGHKFDPETGSVIFTVTAGATDAAVSFEHYNRWRAEAGN